MNILAIFLLSVLCTVTCDSNGPQGIIFPTDPPKTLSPTKAPVEELITRIKPKDEEGFVELPEWMDVDLNKVPLDKLSLLSSANNLSELASLFGLTQEQEDKLELEREVEEAPGIVGLRGAGSNLIAREAESGACRPSLELVELEAPPGNVYLPKCVRLMRCGGCCGTDLLSCQPTKSEAVKIKVINASNNGRFRRGTRARAKYTTVNQVNHTACKCHCTTQESHCEKNIHDYKPDECACVCKNRGEEAVCSAKSTHHWDRRDCSCKCHSKKQCSTGEDFSQDTCRCVRKVIFGESSKNKK